MVERRGYLLARAGLRNDPSTVRRVGPYPAALVRRFPAGRGTGATLPNPRPPKRAAALGPSRPTHIGVTRRPAAEPLERQRERISRIALVLERGQEPPAERVPHEHLDVVAAKRQRASPSQPIHSSAECADRASSTSHSRATASASRITPSFSSTGVGAGWARPHEVWRLRLRAERAALRLARRGSAGGVSERGGDQKIDRRAYL